MDPRASPPSKATSPKVDIKSLTPEEQRIFRLFGRVPSQSHHFARHLKAERKYFDSGDYAMSKAGIIPATDLGSLFVGHQHPAPQDIPHPSPPPMPAARLSIVGASASSPPKSSSLFALAAKAAVPS